MSTTLTLPYLRFVRQVSSGPGALPQFVAMMNDNLEKLKVADWVKATAPASTVSMPANAPLTFTPSDAYDAYKMSSTTTASGVETAYAGMAAYRFAIPSDAISGNKYIRGLTVTLGADKFAYSGIKVAIHASNTSTPTTDWDFIRTGGYGSTLDTSKEFATYDADPEVYGVLTGHVASVSTATNQAAEYTFDLSGLGNTNYSYLWVYITMFNYTDYRASRQYWVEGSGVVNAATASVTFASDVTPDTDVLWNGWSNAAASYKPASGQENDTAMVVRVPGADGYNYPYEQFMAGFPEFIYGIGQRSATQFNGSTGTSIGVRRETSLNVVYNVVYGAYVLRYLPMSSANRFTKLKFSAANMLSLSGKKVRFKMVIWGGTATVGDTYYSLDTYPKKTYDGLYQSALFQGSASTSVKMYREQSNLDVGPWTLTKIGQYELSEIDYTSTEVFAINFTGVTGTAVVLVTIVPVQYWGSVGADTAATWTPGTYLYLR